MLSRARPGEALSRKFGSLHLLWSCIHLSIHPLLVWIIRPFIPQSSLPPGRCSSLLPSWCYYREDGIRRPPFLQAWRTLNRWRDPLVIAERFWSRACYFRQNLANDFFGWKKVRLREGWLRLCSFQWGGRRFRKGKDSSNVFDLSGVGLFREKVPSLNIMIGSTRPDHEWI